MSRGRRPYTPLDVEDDEAQRIRASPKKERRQVHWLEEQPACAGLFQRLPALFAPCALNSLRIAFEELEERYKELELRHSGAVDAVRQEKASRAADAQAVSVEIAALEQKLQDADLKAATAQQDLLRSQGQVQAAEGELKKLTAKLAAEQAEKSAAHDSIRLAEADTQRLAAELKAEQEEHQTSQSQLRAAHADTIRLSASLSTAEQANGRLRKQLEGSEKKAEGIAEELNRQTEEAQRLLQQFRTTESELKIQVSAAENRADKLSAEVGDLKDAASRLEEELKAAKQSAAAVSEELSAQTAEAHQSACELQAKGTHCQKLEFDLQAERQAVASLSQQLEDAKAEVEGLEEKLRSTETSLADAEEQVSEMYTQAQAAKADLAAVKRDAAAAQDMLKATRGEAGCLVEELEAAHEEGFRLADRLQTAEATIARLESTGSASTNVNGNVEASASSGAPESRPFSGSLHDLSSSPGKEHANVWDSAADILRPADNGNPACSPKDKCSSLPKDFRKQEVWQRLWEEGASAGWLASPEEIERGEILGRGTFGVTHMGSLRGQEAAIKCVRVEQESHYRTFVREVGALTRVRHPNVMRLLEWLYGKNGRGATKRTVNEKVAMCVGIAQGMLALESAQPPVMHRDLKPSNVMLDAEGVPKLSDFGLCREHLEDEAYTYTGETGSYTYMSPEMMRGDIYGPPTDVYSFAILMTEILKQRPPFEEHYITPMQTAEGVAYHDLRPQLPSGLPGGVKPLLEACWDAEPEGRPTFAVIASHLADILSKLPPPRRGFFS